MIDTSSWSSCSRKSPWLACSGHTISSTGPSVSPFRDFFVDFRRSYAIVLRYFFSHNTWSNVTLSQTSSSSSYQEGKPRRENGSEDQDQAQEQGIQLAADDAGEKK